MAFDGLVHRYHLQARRHIATVLTVLVVVVLGLGLVRTVYRNRDWRNIESLTMSGLATYPNSAKWQKSLAAVHLQRGDRPAALKAYQRAMAIYPDYPLRYWKFAQNLGTVLFQLGNHKEGIGYLQRSIQTNPNYMWGHYNLGYAYLGTGAWGKAAAHFRKVLELEPSRPGAKKGLATAEAKLRAGNRQ